MSSFREPTRTEKRLMEALSVAVVLLALEATDDMSVVLGLLMAVAFTLVVLGGAVWWAYRREKT